MAEQISQIAPEAHSETENILNLLDSVQEQQNQAEQNRVKSKAGSEGGDASSKEGGTPGMASEEAYEKLMESVDLSDVQPPEGETLFKNKPITDYDRAVYASSQLDEIEKGINHNIDVSYYDDPSMLFRQMREIRLGLEQGVDVSIYANKYYKDRQMREIRLGLMQGYDVSSYARLIYSLPDMEKKRTEIISRIYKKDPKKTDFFFIDRDTGISIYTDEGQMRAFIRLEKELPKGYTKANLDSLLYLYGVSDGLLLDSLDLAKLEIGEEYQVAQGEPSVIGEDGYYEYLVANIGDNKPRVLEDGSVDYRSQRAFAAVRAGDRIAIYHPATHGKLGKTVTGLVLPAYSGRNKKRLDTDGKIRLEDDGATYTAQKDGFVTVQDGRLKILDLLEFHEDIGYANGNILFDGSIHVYGNVQESAIIEAAGDIIIDGYVESATLKSGGDIIIAKGINGNEKGRLEAKGNVVAAFFENAKVLAGGNVDGAYVLNSKINCGGVLKTAGRKSQIAGGQVRAGLAVETGNIGSEAHVRTEVEVGQNQDFSERMASIAERKKRLEAEIAKVKLGMASVLQKVGAVKGRTNEIYLKFQDVLEKQLVDMNNLEKEKTDLEEEIQESEKVYIQTYGTAYENTRIIINGKAAIIREDVRGARYTNVGGMIQSNR